MAEQRACDRCHRKMEPYRSRKRDENGDLLCEGCANGREGRPLTGMKIAKKITKPTLATAHLARIEGHIVRLAHGGGDNVTIFHCPMCGSGQVVARSDGTTECEFCDSVFIVQIQPQHPEMPQTINGVPYQIPGMPAGGDQPKPDNGLDMDPNDPNAQGEPEDDSASFGGDDLADKAGDPGEEEDSFPKQSMFITRDGVALSLESYLKHLAIQTSDDPEATLAEVRQSNV